MSEYLMLRPKLAAVLLASILLGSSLILLSIQVNNAWEVYIPQDATKDFYDEMRDLFVEDTVLVALFEGERLYEPDFLRAFDAVGKQVEAHPLVERVLSVTTMDRIQGTADGFSVGLLIDPEEDSETSEDELQQRIIENRFAPGLIAARDGLALALLVRPIKLDESLDRLAVKRAVEDAVAEHGIEDHLTAVAGEVAQDVALFYNMLLTTLVVLPGAMVLGVLILWWLFRRWKLLVLAVATMLGALVPCVAFVILLGQPYNLVTVIIPALIPGLAAALLMHLSNAMLLAERRGHRGEERVRQGVAAVWRPAFFTALTTAAGLLSLTMSPLVAISTLGIATAFGMGLIFFIVMVLLPPIIASWETESWSQHARGLEGLNGLLQWTARIALRRAGWVVGIAIVTALIALPQAFKVVSDGDFYYWLKSSNEVVISTHHVQDRLTGVSFMEVVFDAPGRDGLTEPERLRNIRGFQEWLDEVPEVAYSVSMTDLIEEMHWAFNEESPEFLALPDDRALIAQYLFIYDGRELWELTDRELARTRIVTTLSLTNATDLGRVADQVREYLAQADLGDLEWRVSGRGPLFAHQQKLLRDGQIQSLQVALPLIFLLLLITWRHLPSTLLCLLPNIAPLTFIFILMGAAGFWLDAGTVITASVVVGVGVDDTIHLYNAYWRRRRKGIGVTYSLYRAIRETGRALTATTIVLAGMFLLLLTSGFRPVQHFGVLATVGVITALIWDLFVLPGIVVLYHKFFGDLRKSRKGQEVHVERQEEPPAASVG